MKWWDELRAGKFFPYIIVVGAVILLLIVLGTVFQLRFFLYDDLSISITPAQSKLQTTESEIDMIFDIKTNAFAMCSSSCEFTITDLATEQSSSSTQILTPGVPYEQTYTQEGLSGFEERLYSFEVSCQNLASFGCKESSTRYRSAIVSVTKQYSKEELEKKVEIESKLQSSHDELEEAIAEEQYYNSLAFYISSVTNHELLLKDELQSSILGLEEAKQHYESQRFEEVKTTMIPGIAQERAQLETEVQRYNKHSQMLNALLNESYWQAYQFFVRSQDERAEGMRIEYHYLKSLSLHSFETMIAAQIENSYNSLRIMIQGFQEEQDLYEAGLRTELADYESILARTQSIPVQEDFCLHVTTLTALTENHNRAVLETPIEYSNEVTFIAKGLLSVTSNASHLINGETSLRNAGGLTIAEYLSYVSYPEVPNDYCQEVNRTALHYENFSSIPIPTLQMRNTSLELAAPAQRCCLFEECEPCALDTTRYPVIFLHGHSFNKDNPPEASIQAFSWIQQELAEDKVIINAGDIDYTSLNQGVLSHMNLPLGMKASYYTISYYDDAESLSIATRKEEGIEVYSIRLKELIDVALEQSGAEKVIIVAHSMGSLVARNYLLLFGEEKISEIVLIAPPNNGVSGRVKRLCNTIGEAKACEDLSGGSVLLRRINNYQAQVPIHLILGSGCSTDDKDGDGIVAMSSANLSYAASSTIIQGSCSDVLGTSLHNDLLSPELYPKVVERLERILK